MDTQEYRHRQAQADFNEDMRYKIKEEDMVCKCGFKFAGAGEFRNCEAFITKEGNGGIICPKCNTAYVDGQEVKLKEGKAKI